MSKTDGRIYVDLFVRQSFTELESPAPTKYRVSLDTNEAPKYSMTKRPRSGKSKLIMERKIW